MNGRGVPGCSLDFDPVRPDDGRAFQGQRVHARRSQARPGFEILGVGGDCGVDLGGFGQGPRPDILILDVSQEIGLGLVRKEITPGKNGSGAIHVEVDLVSLVLEFREKFGLFLEFFLVRPVVVEDYDALGVIRQLPQLIGFGRDIDEEHKSIFYLWSGHSVAVSPSDEFAFASPCCPGGPSGSETIWAGRMVDAYFPHGKTLTDRAPQGALRFNRSVSEASRP